MNIAKAQKEVNKFLKKECITKEQLDSISIEVDATSIRKEMEELASDCDVRVEDSELFYLGGMEILSMVGNLANILVALITISEKFGSGQVVNIKLSGKPIKLSIKKAIDFIKNLIIRRDDDIS